MELNMNVGFYDPERVQLISAMMQSLLSTLVDGFGSVKGELNVLLLGPDSTSEQITAIGNKPYDLIIQSAGDCQEWMQVLLTAVPTVFAHVYKDDFKTPINATIFYSGKAHIVFNATKSVALVFTDKHLAYNCRKSSSSNLYDKEGMRNNPTIQFVEVFGEEDCSLIEVMWVI